MFRRIGLEENGNTFISLNGLVSIGSELETNKISLQVASNDKISVLAPEVERRIMVKWLEWA